MKNGGFVKIHRKILDNPIVVKDGETFAIWLYLLLNATHKDTDVLFKGKRITLKPGQLITGILSISKKLKVNKDKVQRTLKSFENDKQIEQQTSNRNRLITIVNWVAYQKVDKQNDKQVINKCETDDKQMITNKNIKNVKNNKNIKEKINKKEKFQKPTLEELKDYIKEKGFNVSAEAFIDYYESNGWKVGKNPMKNWKSTINGWNRREAKPVGYSSRETLSEKMKRLKKEAEEYDRREALINDKN